MSIQSGGVQRNFPLKCTLWFPGERGCVHIYLPAATALHGPELIILKIASCGDGKLIGNVPIEAALNL